MDHVRAINDTLIFTPFNYEHIVFLPEADREQFVDVKISLHGQPHLTDTGGSLGTGCEDVHFYVDSIDFTPLLVEDLGRKLDSLDQDLLLRQYKLALDGWLELEKRMGAYPEPDLAKEQRAADRLLSIRPLSKNLEQLGHHTAGWSGNLHIFNFLYTFIPLPPVSLNALIERYNATAPAPLRPQTLRTATFSSGPCRLYNHNWDPKDPARGSLAYLIEGHYHDPLEDRVKALEEKLEKLQRKLTNQLDAITAMVGTAGPIQKKLSEVKTIALSANSELADCKLQLTNHEKQVEVLGKEVRSLKDAVEHL